jgi:predicted dehydrogenase
VSYANLVAGTAPCQVHGLHHLGPTGVDEHFAGTLLYGNGLVAQFQVGFRAVYETAVRIVGTAGVLDIPRPFRPATAAHVTIRRGESQDTVAISGRDVFVDELDDFEATVLDGRPATMPLADSRALALTLETLDASARAGATLTLPA